MHTYYQIPLNAEAILQKQQHAKCRLEDSIRQHIHLILKSHYGENRFDPHYGCYIWDKDFENIQSMTRWKDGLEDLVVKGLREYEKRLSNIAVSIRIDEPEITDPKTNRVTKPYKRISIEIRGTIQQTNQVLHHTELMFLSPLSLG